MRYFDSRAFAADVYGEQPRRRDLSLNGRNPTVRRRSCKKLADPTPVEAEANCRQDRFDWSTIANSDPHFGYQAGELIFDPGSETQVPAEIKPVIINGSRMMWSFG